MGYFRRYRESPDNIALCCGFWPGLDQDWDRGTKTNANWICCELSPDFLQSFSGGGSKYLPSLIS